jgi:hypothetical protein
VWKSVGLMNEQNYTEIPIVFEDVRFHRTTSIPKEGSCNSIVHYTVSVYGKPELWMLIFLSIYQYV